jgi:diguanylate cyclase (GGDEF)-like protein
MALQQVAAALKSSLRETDILGRIGGEEFSVLLPDTKLDAAALLAERICRNVESSLLNMPGRKLAISLTVSVGVVELSTYMHGIDDMLRHADTALYHAKHDGRNRVMAYRGEDEASDLSSNQDVKE